MNNPYQPSAESQWNEDSSAVSPVATPLAVLLLGALSSSILAGALAYKGSEGALRFACAFSVAFFVAGAICSLIPALKIRKRLMAGESVDRFGYILVAVFSIPIASAVLIFVLLAIMVLIAVLTGNFSAT